MTRTTLLLALLLAACAGPTPEQETEGPITLGVVWPFSNRTDQFREGIDMAVDEINNQGGLLGRTLETRIKDDAGKITQGKTAAQTLGEDPEVAAVIGHYHSHIAVPASVTYAFHNQLLITPGATDPRLTAQGFRGVFQTIPNDGQIGTQLAEIAAAEGYQKTVIIHEQSAYGRQLANAIEFRAEELGLNVADRIAFDPESEEPRLIFGKLRLLDYQVVLFAGFGKDAARFQKTAVELDQVKPMIGANALDTPALFGDNPEHAEGTLLVSVFHGENPNPYVQSFNQRFFARYNRLPDAWAAQAYDAVQIYAHAVRLAQTTDTDAVTSSMSGIKDWYGVTGHHGFDAKGEVIGKPMIVKVARGGTFSFYRGDN